MKRNFQIKRAGWFLVFLVICFLRTGEATAGSPTATPPSGLVWKAEADGSLTVSGPGLATLRFQPHFSGLLEIDDPEINFVAARRGSTLYLALMNQSERVINTGCQLNRTLVGAVPGRLHNARLWMENKSPGRVSLSPANFQVRVEPRGITVLAIEDLKIEPRFQGRIHGKQAAWKQEKADLALGSSRAMVLNFGPELTWAYVYSQAREEFKEVILHYSTGGDSRQVTDTKFPFEFSVPLDGSVREFLFRIEGISPTGAKLTSETGRLAR